MAIFQDDGLYCVRIDCYRGRGRQADRWAVEGFWRGSRATTRARDVYPSPERAGAAAEKLWELYLAGKVGQPDPPPTTVAEAAERFYTRTEGRTGRSLSPKTEAAYRSQTAGLLDLAGDLPPTHLSAAHVRAHVETPASGHSRAAYLRADRAMVRHWLAKGWVKVDVTASVHVDPGPVTIRPWPSPVERELVMAHASPATRVRLGFIYETALRASEAVRARWDWIRWGIGLPTLEVPAIDPDGTIRKGRKGRSVPLSDDAQEWIRQAGERWGKDGYLLHGGRLVKPGRRGVWDPEAPQAETTWYHDLQRACEIASEAETKRLARPVTVQFGLHALRRAAVARWLAAGAKPHVVQRWTGHANLKTLLDHYGGIADATSAAEMRLVIEQAKLPQVSGEAKKDEGEDDHELRS